MRCLVALVGPTAVGKTALALGLARHFPIEIVSADSRQVYRSMDIGTGKPNPAEMQVAPHHLVDVVEPDESFTLADYWSRASTVIEDIQGRGKIPLLVGGTGLYVWSLVEGWRIPRVPPDTRLRSELEQRAELGGSDTLHQELASIDPAAAARMDPRNLRRIVRALEIYYLTGQAPSRLQGKEAPDFPVLIVGLTQERGDLYRRVDARVDAMIAQGLVKEVEELLNRGYGLSLPSMSGIGYGQIGRFLRGEMELAEAVDRMKHETHRLVRHQYTWFRLDDRRIYWFDIGDAVAGSRRLLEDFAA